jgi:hypothetical protein
MSPPRTFEPPAGFMLSGLVRGGPGILFVALLGILLLLLLILILVAVNDLPAFPA